MQQDSLGVHLKGRRGVKQEVLAFNVFFSSFFCPVGFLPNTSFFSPASAESFRRRTTISIYWLKGTAYQGKHIRSLSFFFFQTSLVLVLEVLLEGGEFAKFVRHLKTALIVVAHLLSCFCAMSFALSCAGCACACYAVLRLRRHQFAPRFMGWEAGSVLEHVKR